MALTQRVKPKTSQASKAPRPENSGVRHSSGCWTSILTYRLAGYRGCLGHLEYMPTQPSLQFPSPPPQPHENLMTISVHLNVFILCISLGFPSLLSLLVWKGGQTCKYNTHTHIRIRALKTPNSIITHLPPRARLSWPAGKGRSMGLHHWPPEIVWRSSAHSSLELDIILLITQAWQPDHNKHVTREPIPFQQHYLFT